MILDNRWQKYYKTIVMKELLVETNFPPPTSLRKTCTGFNCVCSDYGYYGLKENFCYSYNQCLKCYNTNCSCL